MVNGNQLTVTWHVDDLKASHVDPKAIDEFIIFIKKNYEEEGIGKAKTTRGKHHTYLGMNLDFSTAGKVKINMTDYVKNMLEEFPENTSKKATTPAAQHLFKTREDDVQHLTEKQRELFHRTTAQAYSYVKEPGRIFN